MSYFQTGKERARQVNLLFDRIASRYDLINDIQSFGMHRIWKKWLWLLSQPKRDDKVLDVCCGTGDIAFLFAEKGCEVTGVDFSEEMLKVALTRASSLNSQRKPLSTHFQQADALALPFDDNSFDIVTIGYGLRNLANIGVGLKEMHRVLKPGGKLLILEFGKPDNRLLRALYFGYLRIAVPLFGSIFCGNSAAYAYILESLNHYPAQRGVHSALHQLGFANVRITNFLGGAMSINYAEKPVV